MTVENLKDLLWRMTYPEKPTNSATSVSWNAYHEARSIDDIDLLPHLNQIVSESSKDERRAAIFVIGCIGANTHRLEIVSTLLAQLQEEQHKSIIEALLSALEKQPDIPPNQRLFELSTDPRYSIRHSTILVLASSKYAETEKCLLSILEKSTDTTAIAYANGALGKIGSSRAIPALINKVASSSDGVASTALCALSKLGDRSLLPVFMNSLKHKTVGGRWAAMIALNEFGDDSVVDAVIERIQIILKRQRKVQQSPKSELLHGLEILYRYQHQNEKAASFLQLLLLNYREMLFPQEIKWIEKQL